MDSTSLSNDINYISELLIQSEKYGLTAEVVAFALIYMKKNPSSSIKDAIIFGFNEWIK